MQDYKAAMTAFRFASEHGLPLPDTARDVEVIGLSATPAVDGCLAAALEEFADAVSKGVDPESAFRAVAAEHGDDCFDTLSRGYCKLLGIK